MKAAIGAGMILLIILFSGIWFDAALEAQCLEYDTSLSACITQVDMGNWDTCLIRLDEIEAHLGARRTFLAAFTHHNLIEQIYNALTRTRAAASRNDVTLFTIESQTLAEAIAALKESDKANLANIF